MCTHYSTSFNTVKQGRVRYKIDHRPDYSTTHISNCEPTSSNSFVVFSPPISLYCHKLDNCLSATPNWARTLNYTDLWLEWYAYYIRRANYTRWSISSIITSSVSPAESGHTLLRNGVWPRETVSWLTVHIRFGDVKISAKWPQNASFMRASRSVLMLVMLRKLTVYTGGR